MAFADGTLVQLNSGNSNAGSLWLYKEAATLAAVRAANYLDNGVDYGIADGDLIIFNCSDGFGLNLLAVSAGAVTVGEALTSA